MQVVGSVSAETAEVNGVPAIQQRDITHCMYKHHKCSTPDSCSIYQSSIVITGQKNTISLGTRAIYFAAPLFTAREQSMVSRVEYLC